MPRPPRTPFLYYSGTPGSTELHRHNANVLDILGISERSLEETLRLETEPRFGFELELETAGESNTHLFEQIQSWFVTSPFFIAKRDGTCSGAEIVSLPLSLTEQSRFLDTFSISATTPRNCGMHIHLSKCKTTVSQRARMIMTVYSANMFRFMTKIALRAPNAYCRRNHLYTNPRNIATVTERPSNKYEALNFRNPHTIEIRMFAATTDPALMKAHLEFAHALWVYTRAERDNMLELAIPYHFIEFVEENTSLYPNLARRFSYHRFREFRRDVWVAPPPEAEERAIVEPRRRTRRRGPITPLPPSTFSRQSSFHPVMWMPMSPEEIRFHPIGHLRTRSHTPSHDEVHQFWTSAFGSLLSDRVVANQSAMARYVAWYSRESHGMVVSANGREITGVDLFDHARYHLRIVQRLVRRALSNVTPPNVLGVMQPEVSVASFVNHYAGGLTSMDDLYFACRQAGFVTMREERLREEIRDALATGLTSAEPLVTNPLPLPLEHFPLRTNDMMDTLREMQRRSLEGSESRSE